MKTRPPGPNWPRGSRACFPGHHRTPDRGIPGLNGRVADVSIDPTYGDPQRDCIDDKAQSLRSRLSYDLGPDWQLGRIQGLFKLNSDFDNTYATRAVQIMPGDPRTRMTP